MDWIALETLDDAGARLFALRLDDGSRRPLYQSEHPFPLRASLHPEARRVAVDAVSRNRLRGEYRARVAVVNLETRGVGWLRQSLDPKWRIGGATFDDTGTRLAIEGAYAGAPLSDIYVFDIKLSGNSVREHIAAGVGNRKHLGCVGPCFLPGGEQLLYFHNTRPDGAWELGLLDLTQSGDSAFSLEGRAPSVLSLSLTEGAGAVLESGIEYCAALGEAFFVGRSKAGTRQRIRAVAVNGAAGHRDVGRDHLRIEELCVAPGGELLAYSADGQLWLADVETGAAVSLVAEAGASHRGLTFDLDAGRLVFSTNGVDGSRVRAVSLGDRSVTTLYDLGEATVLHLHRLPEGEEAAARIEALPTEGEGSTTDGDELADEEARTEVMPAPAEADGTPPPEPEPPRVGRALLQPEAGASVGSRHTLPESTPAAAMESTHEPSSDAEPAEPSPTGPAEDFGAWMAELPAADDPAARLSELSEHREDDALLGAALAHLEATHGDQSSGLVFAISAAAQLHLTTAEPRLLRLCQSAYDGLSSEDVLVEAEVHFALAALRAISDGLDFDAGATYAEYEAATGELGGALEDGGEEAASSALSELAAKYREALRAALGIPAPEVVAEEPVRIAEESPQGASAEPSEPPPDAAEDDAEFERRRAEAEAEAAAEAAAEAEFERRRAEAEAAAEAAAEAEFERRRAEAEAAAREDEEFERRRAEAQVEATRAAEAEATLLEAEAADRAAAAERAAEEAAARVAEAERAAAEAAEKEAEAARIRDAATPAPAKPPRESPQPAARDAFNPLSTPAPRQEKRAVRSPPPRRVPFDDLETVDQIVPTGGPGWVQSMAAFGASAGGLCMVLLGVKLGGALIGTGALWIAAAVGLFADKRWGWYLALAAYLLNGATLVRLGVEASVSWIPPAIPMLSGVAALLVTAALFTPSVRRRFTGSRPRF